MINKTKIFIYSHSTLSNGAKQLAKGLNAKRIKHSQSKFKDTDNKIIINWGSSSMPYTKARVLNPPNFLSLATNKLRFFETMERFKDQGGPSIPPWTQSTEKAKEWLSDNKIVIERHKLTGHSGVGIKVVEKINDLSDNVPLYTQYIKKKEEYRVHIVDQSIIDIQRKVLPERNKQENINWKIRNHQNGFIYQKNDIKPPDKVIEEAMKAHSKTQLDFGAYDIIWNDKHQQAYVLEVNTAPGIENTTVDNYVKGLKELLCV